MKNKSNANKFLLKARLLIFVLFTAVFFSACEKDENGLSKLIGKWEGKSYSRTIIGVGGFTEDYPLGEGCKRPTFEFTETDFKSAIYDEECMESKFTGTYKTDGINITFYYDSGTAGKPIEATYTIVGDRLTITTNFGWTHIDYFDRIK